MPLGICRRFDVPILCRSGRSGILTSTGPMETGALRPPWTSGHRNKKTAVSTAAQKSGSRNVFATPALKNLGAWLLLAVGNLLQHVAEKNPLIASDGPRAHSRVTQGSLEIGEAPKTWVLYGFVGPKPGFYGSKSQSAQWHWSGWPTTKPSSAGPRRTGEAVTVFQL